MQFNKLFDKTIQYMSLNNSLLFKLHHPHLDNKALDLINTFDKFN